MPKRENEKFQFHYGTVERVLWGDSWINYLNFNSNMMRLKEYAVGYLTKSET